MKKLCIIFLILLTTSIVVAQKKSNYTVDGFKLKIPFVREINTICRPTPDGYFPPQQQKAVYEKTVTSVETFHTSEALEYFKKTLNEKSISNTTTAKMSAEYEGVGTSIEASAQNSYLNSLEESVNRKTENTQDITNSVSTTKKIELEPGKEVQLYQVTVKIPGEYEYTYDSPKVPDSRKKFTYNVIYDYSAAPRELFGIIKDIQCGTDKGEWEKFNSIANKAYLNYDGDLNETWKTFLNEINTQLWTDGIDRTSWGITKEAAANALKQKEPLNQLRAFSSTIKRITNPSHNDWAWERITTFAKKYDF